MHIVWIILAQLRKT